MHVGDRREWTESANRQLRLMLLQRRSPADAALRLGRSLPAVVAQLALLGIPTPGQRIAVGARRAGTSEPT